MHAPFKLHEQEEILAGLKSGRTLIVQRKDDPNLPFLMELHSQGLINMEMVDIDSQSSCMRITWNAPS